MVKFFLSVVIFSLFSSVSPAVELIWHKNQKSQELIYSLYTENGYWNVSLTTVKPGKLQDLKWRKAFSSEKKARTYLQKFLNGAEIENPNGDNYFGQNYVATEAGQQVIWKSENQWNWDWEKKYSQWLGENYTKDFYLNNNIAVDCADNATAIRWIFSRVHKLPVGNTLAGSGVVFTNESFKEEWKDLPTDEDWRKDKLFRAALEYILNNTYTHTMFRDGYPMAINKESFLAGIYMIDLQGETGHTRVVSYVSTDTKGGVPIRILQSGAPRHLQVMSEGPFGANPVKGKDEMLKNRWPIKNGDKWELIPAEKMPHYSLEQFDPNFPGQKKVFTLAVYDRIVPGFDPLKLIVEGIDQLLVRFAARDKIVNEGYAHCSKKSCPEGTKDWEDWSTPLRDQQLFDTFNSLEKIALIVSELDQTAKQIWNEGMNLKFVSIQDVRATLKQILFVWRFKLYNSDPNIPPAQRWSIGFTETVKTFSQRVKSLLDRRAVETKKNSCNQCAKDSQEWKDSNTHKLDNEIQRFYLGVIQYCETFPPFCEWFRNNVREQVWSGENQTLSLSNWLEKSLWFNSDPRASNEIRWGKLQSFAVPVHGLVGPKTSIAKNEILLGNSFESRSLFDLRERKPLAPPAGFSVEDLEATQGLALVLNQQSRQIGVLEPRSNQLVTLNLNFAPLKTLWHSPHLVTGKISPTKVFAVKFADGKFSNYSEIDVTAEEASRITDESNQFPFYYEHNKHYLSKPRDIFYVSHEKTKITIYDFLGKDMTKTVVAHEFVNDSYPKEFPQFIVHASNSHYSLAVNIIKHECPQQNPECSASFQTSYGVEKSTGKTTPLGYYPGKILPNGKFLTAIKESTQQNEEVFVATLGEDFKIKERGEKIGRFYMVNESGYIFFSKRMWEGGYFRVKDDSTFELLFETSQNFWAKSFSGDMAVVATQSGEGIFDLNSKKMLAKFQMIYPGDGYLTVQSPFFSAGSLEEWGLYRYSDKSDIPIVTGLSTFLAQRQQCGMTLNMRMGGYTEFRDDYNDVSESTCYGDRNYSDGMIFYLMSGRAYYLPANISIGVK